MYQFRLQPNDTIESYTSPVGNNFVPYPFLITTHNVYFMLDKTFVPIHDLPKLSKTEMTDLYSVYIESLSKHAKQLRGVKQIHRRV